MTHRNSIAAMKDEITGYRRALHEHPATSYEEEFANDLIQECLKEWDIPFESGWAETGVVAVIEGQKTDSGKSVGLRADIDALDIDEKSGQPWASKIPCKMHGCGHDGHTAMMLGAAKYLNDTKNFNGTVHLIFQPAEEGGAGAVKMIEEGLFKKHPVDAVFGLHNWPMMPKGKFGTRPGPIMASVDEVHITINGKGGHAAMPHLTIDPVIISSQIINALQTLISRTIDPVDQAVISITNFNAGTGASNVIPETAKLMGSIRTFKQETRDMIKQRIPEMASKIAEAMGATAETYFKDGYDPTINSEKETAFCSEIAKSLFGEDNVDDNVDPCMGAEDFGAMLAEKPGCYVWLGQGEDKPDSPHSQSLHHHCYDFNDEIIPQGIEYWAELVEKYMPLDK